MKGWIDASDWLHSDGRANSAEDAETMLSKCRAKAQPLPLYFPPGRYRLSAPLRNGSPEPGKGFVSMAGAGRDYSEICYSGPGPVIDFSGNRRLEYVESGFIRDIRVIHEGVPRGVPRTSCICISTTLTGQARLQDLDLLTNGIAIHSSTATAFEAVGISCRDVRIRMYIPEELSEDDRDRFKNNAANRLWAGVEGRYNNLTWIGGRVYDCRIGLRVGGDGQIYSGANFEYCNIAVNQLEASALKFVGCAFESGDVLFTNAIILPDFENDVWSDPEEKDENSGNNMRGSAFFDACYVAFGAPASNLVVLKHAQVHNFRMVGCHVAHGSALITKSFVRGRLVTLPKETNVYLTQFQGVPEVAPWFENAHTNLFLERHNNPGGFIVNSIGVGTWRGH